MAAPSLIERFGPALYELPTRYREGIGVPVRVFATEKLLAEMDDKVFEQAANLATLPGIVEASFAMPDAHWGYGFPIGGVAAMDPETGVISAGGIGFDINCGMRLVRTDLTWPEVEPHGPTLGAVFAAAAQALLAATVEDPDSVERRERRCVTLEEPDIELRLLRFRNELVYLRDAEELLLHADRISITRDSGARLAGELAGERIDPGRHPLATDVKAATAHGLCVASTPDGWTAAVTLDV
jgi:SHS2 domain-containing protein